MTLPAQETRAKLLAETLALMDEGGLEAVKARELARRTGVSVGTIYNVFGTLDGLLAEACEAILTGFGETAMEAIRAAEALRARKPPAAAPDLLKDRLLTLSRIYMAYVEKNERRWAAMLAFNRTRRGDPDARYEQLQGDLFGFIASALEGTPFGETPSQRRRTARMLWSAVHGIVTMNYVGQASRASKAETWEQVQLLVSVFVGAVAR